MLGTVIRHFLPHDGRGSSISSPDDIRRTLSVLSGVLFLSSRVLQLSRLQLFGGPDTILGQQVSPVVELLQGKPPEEGKGQSKEVRRGS